MSQFLKRNRRGAKLDPGQVRKIRELYASGNFSQGELARDFVMSGVQIGRIVRGESWADLPPTLDTVLARGIESATQAASEVAAKERLARSVQEVKDREAAPDKMIEELQADLGEDAKSRLDKLLGND